MTKTMLREAERHADDCEACIGTGWLTACMNAAPCPFCNSKGRHAVVADKQERLTHANAVLRAMGSHGRRFFFSKEKQGGGSGQQSPRNA